MSWSDVHDDHHTGLSDSEGTSQEDGEASTLTSVSIEIQEYFDFYADNDGAAQLTVELRGPERKKAHSKNDNVGFTEGLGGVEWIGDSDNEMIFGTAWLDSLTGSGGDDEIRGLEGNDYLTGGDGVDKLWGDAGDDEIYTSYGPEESGFGADYSNGHGDFASGGSGNDIIRGS